MRQKDHKQVDFDGSSHCQAGEGSNRKKASDLHFGFRNVQINSCLVFEVVCVLRFSDESEDDLARKRAKAYLFILEIHLESTDCMLPPLPHSTSTLPPSSLPSDHHVSVWTNIRVVSEECNLQCLERGQYYHLDRSRSLPVDLVGSVRGLLVET